MAKEILIYALPAGETERYMEDLISSHCRTAADVEKVKAAATVDGWHCFRVTTYDGSAPNFGNVLA